MRVTSGGLSLIYGSMVDLPKRAFGRSLKRSSFVSIFPGKQPKSGSGTNTMEQWSFSRISMPPRGSNPMRCVAAKSQPSHSRPRSEREELADFGKPKVNVLCLPERDILSCAPLCSACSQSIGLRRSTSGADWSQICRKGGFALGRLLSSGVPCSLDTIPREALRGRPVLRGGVTINETVSRASAGENAGLISTISNLQKKTCIAATTAMITIRPVRVHLLILRNVARSRNRRSQEHACFVPQPRAARHRLMEIASML